MPDGAACYTAAMACWPTEAFFLHHRNLKVHDSLKRKGGSNALLVEAGKGRGIDFRGLLILFECFF